MVNNQANRYSGIELLRILSAIMVLVYHSVNTIIDIDSLSAQQKIITTNIFYGGGRFAVNIFVIIGAWFLCDRNFKFRRILNLWFVTFLYSIIVGAIFFIAERSLLFCAKQLFPITTEAVWFISCYIILLVVSPLLNVLIYNPKLHKIIVLIATIYILVPTILPISAYKLSNIGWFIMLYLLTGVLKKSGLVERVSKGKYLIIAIITFLFFYEFSILFFVNYNELGTGTEVLNKMGFSNSHFFKNINSLPPVICAYTLFLIFYNIRIRTNIISSVILFISATTIDVYVLLAMNGPDHTLFWCELLDLKNRINGMLELYIICFLVFVITVLIGRIRSIVVNTIFDKFERTSLYRRISLFFSV